MKIATNKLKLNPDNPRFIRDGQYKKLLQSIKEFPEMAEARPIIINPENVILGGNMRYRAMKELGWKEVPVKIVDWPEDKQREFIIKDNISYGDWDYDILANEWDNELLDEWGMTKPRETNQEQPLVDDTDIEAERFKVITIVPPETPQLKERIAFHCKTKEQYDQFLAKLGPKPDIALLKKILE